MRMFVALLPPPEAVEHLDEFLAPRRASGGDLRWADPTHVHVTLAFAAEVPGGRVDDLLEALADVAGRRTAFGTRIAGGGAFPDPAGARVLWAGLGLAEDDRATLERLAASARAAASRSGARVDGQRFRPHVTVARLARPTEVGRWVRLLDTYEGPSWTADRLSLVHSHLGERPRGRPRHEVVGELPLA